MTEENFQPRSFARPLRLALMTLLTAMLCAVAWLQLRPAEELAHRSRVQQTRRIYVPAKRGELQDRDGRALNYSYPSYSIVIRPDLVRDPRDTRIRTLDKLSTVIANLSLAMGAEFNRHCPDRDDILRHLKEKPALPLVLWDEVDSDTLARWAAIRNEYPASELLLTWRRAYDFPDIAPHWRGYTRLDTPRDDGFERYWNANTRELLGVSGMEKALEPLLRGQGGAQLLQTDVLSYRSHVLESRPASAGDACRLSLHLPTQQVVQGIFQRSGYKGAAVAMDMETGEILVMHSAPCRSLAGTVETAAAGDTEVNRVLAGFYPPGSTLKPLLALYAMDLGLASWQTSVFCNGGFQLTSRSVVKCTNTHNRIATQASIAQSCNTFYCQLATSLPHKALDDFAQEFGFGERTGSLLQGQEISGIPFSPTWVKTKRRQDPIWHRGDGANAGIGQGGWAVTPMQMLLAMNYALTGKLITPVFHRGENPVIRKERQWNPNAQKVIINGMRECVTAGTGRRALLTTELPILAKTGTAETGRTQRPHAWVVAAAPAHAPRHLVVVVIEHGGGGGRVAGPVAKEILLALNKITDK